MQDKLKWMLIGYALLFVNIATVGTRLNSVGLVCGLAGAVCFLKSLSIRK